ncbi:protein CHROMOSOME TRANSMISSION FIDELITY 7-like [Neltuma alba]|uniref:protein CHROMOSOME TRANSMISSION FIDELITY 7-like n=1 Tax=Neltuma alba TaxID=207710 RepID=UPI0010A4DC08|nr:protein CHROMOSOME TRANSMISSION FIDELITY 7-like [Prosopis alba]
MQSKIGAFFKSPINDNDDDELTIWEKKEHHIFNTHEDELMKVSFICLMAPVESYLVLRTDPPAQKKKVEEVEKMMDIDLGNGWIIHEHCKVYLFTSPQRIVGCLVAEAIKEVSKVISCSSAGTTLQFDDIIFRRGVEKRASSVNESAGLDTAHGGPIFCEDKAVTAVCGIRAIWMPSSNRRKRIARQLLDAVR